jgi:hypothetical protein
MITTDGKLEVFERFEVDRKLPKFRKPKAPRDANRLKSDDDEESFGHGENEMFTRSTFTITTGNVSAMTVAAQPVPMRWWERARDAFGRFLKASPPPPAEPEPTMTVDDFFASVKNSAEEVTLVETRLAGYKRALQDAERNGQVALREKLAQDVEAVRGETQFRAARGDQAKFVSEEDVVRFYKECKKGLRLDLIRNFMRVVPDDVAAKKARCDELCIFDNYAVLHYDPEAKSYAETEAEKARRRDPILFGLISGRRRLYFVGDWVDEHCDLTLEQMADLLGVGAVIEVRADYEVPT